MATTTLIPPPTSVPECGDWSIDAVVDALPRVRPQPLARAFIAPRERFWLLDARRREDVLASDAAFLVSVAVTILLSGVAAYFYALWTIGPA